MNCIESPLLLKCLLAAYVGDRNYPGWADPNDYSFLKLKREGLVEGNARAQWVATKKGLFFVNAILALPLPETKFVIPT